ncbi:hypothetical protein, partial [Metamycoplasma hyosynoviae]|uniref:hypothetical protein n=1 Tax=Metamycoplasma hyosynoviae TaxID=29559 RepID=UPI0023671668
GFYNLLYLLQIKQTDNSLKLKLVIPTHIRLFCDSHYKLLAYCKLISVCFICYKQSTLFH